MKRKIRYHLAMILLHASKPFMIIGNWLWAKHRDLLAKNQD